jgi:hypothetical protein
MTARFFLQRRYFNERKLWEMSPTISSAGDIVQRALPTKNRS